MPADGNRRRLAHMALSRTTLVLAALLSAVPLAGCGGPDAAPSATATSPSPAPSSGAAASWAGDVCSASTALQESVQQMTGAVQTDSSSSSTSLDQTKAQVNDRVRAVQQSAASLDAALSAVPQGADPAVATAQQQLQTASQRAQDAVAQLGDAARQVANAGTAAELATGLVTLKAALTGTAADLGTYLDSLRSTVDSQTEAVREAFSAAPTCANIGPTPSASS